MHLFGVFFLHFNVYQVCKTRGRFSSLSTGSRHRRVVEETSFFSHETEFALTEVLNTIPNYPPEITNLVDIFTINEDEGIHQIH